MSGVLSIASIVSSGSVSCNDIVLEQGGVIKIKDGSGGFVDYLTGASSRIDGKPGERNGDVLLKPSNMNKNISTMEMMERIVSSIDTSVDVQASLTNNSGTFDNDSNLLKKVFPRYGVYSDGIYQNREMGKITTKENYPYSMFVSSFNTLPRQSYKFNKNGYSGCTLTNEERLSGLTETKIDVGIVVGDSVYDVKKCMKVDKDLSILVSDEVLGDVDWDICVSKYRSVEYYDRECSKHGKGKTFLSPFLKKINEDGNLTSQLCLLQGENYVGDYSESGWIIEPTGKYINQKLEGCILTTEVMYDALSILNVCDDEFHRTISHKVSIPFISFPLSMKEGLGDIMEGNVDEESDEISSTFSMLKRGGFKGLVSPMNLFSSEKIEDCVITFEMKKSSNEEQTDRIKGVSYSNTLHTLLNENINQPSLPGKKMVGTKHIFNSMDWAKCRVSNMLNGYTLDEIISYVWVVGLLQPEILSIDGNGNEVDVSDLESIEDVQRYIKEFLESFTNENFYKGKNESMSGGYKLESLTIEEVRSHVCKVLLMRSGFGELVLHKLGRCDWDSAGLWYAINYGVCEPNGQGEFMAIDVLPARDNNKNMEFVLNTNKKVGSTLPCPNEPRIVDNATYGGEAWSSRSLTNSNDFSVVGIVNSFLDRYKKENKPCVHCPLLMDMNIEENEVFYINNEYYPLIDLENHGIKSEYNIILERLEELGIYQEVSVEKPLEIVSEENDSDFIRNCFNKKNIMNTFMTLITSPIDIIQQSIVSEPLVVVDDIVEDLIQGNVDELEGNLDIEEFEGNVDELEGNVDIEVFEGNVDIEVFEGNVEM